MARNSNASNVIYTNKERKAPTAADRKLAIEVFQRTQDASLAKKVSGLTSSELAELFDAENITVDMDLTEDQKAVKAMYEAGASLKEISVTTNISVPTVSLWANKYLFDRSNRQTFGGGGRGRSRKLQDDDLARLKKKYEAGEDIKRLAAEFDVSPLTISSYANADGWSKANRQTRRSYSEDAREKALRAYREARKEGKPKGLAIAHAQVAGEITTPQAVANWVKESA